MAKRLDGVADDVKHQLRETFERIAQLHRKRARDRARKMGDDAAAIRDLDRFDHLPDSLADVHRTKKPHRPDPSTYMDADDLADHLTRFEHGATRFMTRKNYDKYGPGREDGTSFVMSADDVDDLIRRTDGDPRLMEAELGLDPGFFDDVVVRVDIDDPGASNVRMPSGNEAGANEHWLPGGFLPKGVSEAVIDVAGLAEGAGYAVSGFPPDS